MPEVMKPVTDRAYDVFRIDRQPLEAFFAPKTVAVIGATERPGSVGRTLVWNLIRSPFGGTVYPVNPKRDHVLGVRAYPSIEAVPEPVDLAMIATPAATVPDLVQACAAAGVKGAIVLATGFHEIGPAGVALEEQIKAHLRHHPMRLIGPNCLGLMNPLIGLNATFASSLARRGNVGFISQSGALCTAVLDWSLQENVGFSAFVSIGSMLDVDWGDLIYYLGDDPHTRSIVIYMESIGNARSFLSAAREVALTKPIIVIKAGRTGQRGQAAASHTGSLTDRDAVLDAAFRRCGVLRVEQISDLFDLAEVLAKQPQLPQGPRLTIITNAEGVGMLATDALVATGGELATLTEETLTTLKQVLPVHGSPGNPIDILGDADANRYAQAVEVAINDSNSDGVLVVLTPQAMTNPTQTAEALTHLAQKSPKPLLASWMGGAEVTAGETILNQASIPTYRYPDTAARQFNAMWQYSYNLRGIYETPALLPESEFGGGRDRSEVEAIIQAARQEKRTLLTELEAKQVLQAYGIPVLDTRPAYSAEAAVAAAEAVGFPVAVKLISRTLIHKTDVGGVRLNVKTAAEVATAFGEMASVIRHRFGEAAFGGVTVQPMVNLTQGYELIMGSSIDEQFGPVILFGTGGQLVEVYRDNAVALPPLNTTLARRMMEQTKIYQALQGVRGRQATDLAELEKMLVRVSQLALEQPQIRELDINPLLVFERTQPQPLIALDARIVLTSPQDPPLPGPAIRPYPSQYVRSWHLRDGTPITLRPIRPEDEPLLVKFHHTLSEESIYFRYFHLITLNRRIAHERLTRICFIDYDREMALVADHKDANSGEHGILAVGRLSKCHGLNQAEFALLVSDAYQGQGLGTELLQQLLAIARHEGLHSVTAEILRENRPMQRVCERLGFTLTRTPDFVKAEIQLL
ncbi:MAG TPA: bifunctional acetate--CoA ligase family protein/GNAT family N-acetyltransferase [Leptolyngbyaceae cyanobacterium M65_K2018_010]|nr:bifunctional acetate--CoA ligase family protein/GNAT family N-acetyltransferase [Leptolyngbyaceae cyanobacterium M65_K2018_010]